MKKIWKSRPAINLGGCTRCGGCWEIAPQLFYFNEAGGYVDICDLDFYPVEEVEEAMRNCPEDCIYWDHE